MAAEFENLKLTRLQLSSTIVAMQEFIKLLQKRRLKILKAANMKTSSSPRASCAS